MSNKYTYKVPFTTEQLDADYSARMTQSEIGKKYGVSQKVVWRAMLRAGIRSRIAAKRVQNGSANANWKGGTSLTAPAAALAPYLDRGYRMIRRPGHPHQRANGYVAEHIAVALEKYKLERLPDGHCVHHVNLRKDDNPPSNLSLCTHAKHQSYHTQLEELAIRLLFDTGRIQFIDGAGYVETQNA